MSEDKATLLIVEDDIDVAEMLTAYFRRQGYEVIPVNWGEDAIEACQTTLPDLILLDIRLPDLDGYEVARRLRSSRRTEGIPILFLTEKRERRDRLQGFEVGADDYITKPFDIHELRLRVRNALRRVAQNSLTNPVTGLPEGALVDERLKECLEGEGWAMLLVSIEHLDDFREAYGFVASDDVCRAVGLMIQNVLRAEGGPGDFLGHLNATGYLIVTRSESLSDVAGRIRRRLEQSFDFFYPLNDLAALPAVQKRLATHIGQLRAGDGQWKDLGSLKTQLKKELYRQRTSG